MKKQKEIKLQRKIEEAERWWAGAEIFASRKRDEDAGRALP